MEKIWLPGIARFLESLKKTIRFPHCSKVEKTWWLFPKNVHVYIARNNLDRKLYETLPDVRYSVLEVKKGGFFFFCSAPYGSRRSTLKLGC